MNKTIIAVLISIGLFIVGWSYLIAIKNNQKTATPKLVMDFDPYCDETTYLDIGTNDEIVFDNKAPTKKEAPLWSDGPSFKVFDEGQTLHSILRPSNVSEQEVATLGNALKPYLRARDLAAGDLYRFVLVDIDSSHRMVKSFDIRKLDSTRVPILYRVKRKTHDVNDIKFIVEIDEPLVLEEPAVIQLSVNGTLYQTFNQLTFGNELMQRLMGILAWQMRMPEEVLKGDHIEMLVSKKYALGEFIGFGKIDSVIYTKNERVLRSFSFTSADQKIKGFFDEKGKSLEKEFAYSPVHETTATSNQKWRMHPIRKIRIRHNGVDYRGTIGTEFYSIADGEIIEKRYDKNVGNMIRIRHKYGVHSEYFHADTLVEKLAVGSLVKRGQLIGTIGRTGRLCTGPHLHMGLYRLHGTERKYLELSSLRKTLKPAPSIPEHYLAEFQQHQKKLLALIDAKTNLQIAEGIKK